MRLIAERFLIMLPILLVCLAGTAFAESGTPQAIVVTSAPQADIEIFVRAGCSHCAAAEKFLLRLQQEQPGLRIVIRDVGREPAALERLKRLAGNRQTGPLSVPAFAVDGQLIVGFADEASTGQLIRNALMQKRLPGSQEGQASQSCRAEENQPCQEIAPASVAKAESFTVAVFGRTISLDQVGLPLFTVVIGLLDGFNPCSMWVLILMISLLAPLHSRSRMFAVAGTFIAVQGIAYFVFMAAWLNLFLLVGLSRASEVILGTIALLAGALHLKDFWIVRWGVSLSIPAAAKPGIYARMRRVLQAENLPAALLGIVTLAVLVQIVELMCTTGFPALFTRILTLRQLDPLSYYGYLLLYDLAYMLDDMIVLAIGIITLSQRRLQEREGRWLKLLSGLIMVMLGVYLLLTPFYR